MRKFRFLPLLIGLAALSWRPASVPAAWGARNEGPEAPVYADPAAWLRRPAAPAHGVAVFFVHPTSYFMPVTGNARYDQRGLPDALNDATMRMQAGVFSDCCDLWAPQYRQSSLRAITANTPDAYAADDLAYGDVARAFEAFVGGLNGRPFILASHSQGSIHALRLLQERIASSPLQGRMIAAYLVGVALPAQIAAKGVPICAQAVQTGCVVSWNTVRSGYHDARRTEDAVIWWEGRYQPIAGRSIVCVNPVDWRLDGVVDSPGAVSVHSEGRGGVPSAPVAALERAACAADGLLGITIKPEWQGRFSDLLSRSGVFHDFDYGLFFASIAENARQRIAVFPAPR
jgi:Protein of unknown function (DUF3089)